MESAGEEIRAAFLAEAKAEEERRSRLESRRKKKRQQVRVILRHLEKEAQAQRDPVEPDSESDVLVSDPSPQEMNGKSQSNQGDTGALQPPETNNSAPSRVLACH